MQMYYRQAPKKPEVMMCPRCGREMGALGRGFYYCSDCYLEVNTRGSRIRAYAVDVNGNISEVAT